MENPDLSKTWFYHTMDLPGIGPVGVEEGWDLRGRFEEYIGHVRLAGRTVLDVGTASGFLSFEAEQRGAIVTSFDAGSIEDRDDRPQDDQRQYAIDELNRMHAGYELAHSAFNSRAKTARGSIYKLSKIVDAHEVVIVGQILVHLKDPHNALREAAACCSDTLIIAEGSFDAELPYAYFAGGAAATSYWQISNAMYRDWLEKFGFTLVYQNRSSYACRHPNSSPEHQVWTFVARRKEFVKEPPVLLRMTPPTFPQRVRAVGQWIYMMSSWDRK
jgi:hypothetical protein